MMMNMLLPPLVRKWILPLAQNFSKPQRTSLLIVLLGVLLHPGKISLEDARRVSAFAKSLSAIARFLDTEKWKREDLWLPTRNMMTREAIARYTRGRKRMRKRWRKKKGKKVKRVVSTQPIPVYISIDDTLVEKPATSQHFEGFAWHWDHKEKKHLWALCLVSVNMQIGEYVFPGTFEMFLPRRTARKLREKYPGLRFFKKTALALRLLKQFEGMFPKSRFRVNVLADSYYSSSKILNYCTKHKYEAIMAIKKNRKLDGKRIDEHAGTLKHRAWERVSVPSASGTKTESYRVILLTGKLNDVGGGGSVVISKRSRGDKSPKYFFSTNPGLSAREILTRYAKRWQVEIDYFFLKVQLGLKDFRIRKLGAIMRYITIVFVALCFLQYYRWKLSDECKTVPTLAEAIHHFRRGLVERRLKAAYRLFQQNYSYEGIVKKLFAYAV